MFKLMLSLAVVVMLLPEDLRTEVKATQPVDAETIEVTTIDTLSAAQDIYRDISGFCERNVETCITGKAIAGKFVTEAQSVIGRLTGKTQTVSETNAKTDQFVTGSVTTQTE